jgi:hypothetical protein
MSEIAFCARNQTFLLRPLRGLLHPGGELTFIELVFLMHPLFDSPGCAPL